MCAKCTSRARVEGGVHRDKKGRVLWVFSLRRKLHFNFIDYGVV